MARLVQFSAVLLVFLQFHVYHILRRRHADTTPRVHTGLQSPTVTPQHDNHYFNLVYDNRKSLISPTLPYLAASKQALQKFTPIALSLDSAFVDYSSQYCLKGDKKLTITT